MNCIRTLFAAFLILCLFSPLVFADRVRFKNGRTMAGTITEEDSDIITLEAFGGSLRLPAASIEWTIKGSDDFIEKKARTGELFKKANMQMEKQNYHEAASLLEAAVDLEKGSGPLWNNLGAAYAGDREWDKAARAFQQAAALKPADADIAENLANVQLSAGRFKEARVIYHRLLKSSPDKGKLYAKLCIAFYKEGKHAQARRFYKAAERTGVLQRLHAS